MSNEKITEEGDDTEGNRIRYIRVSDGIESDDTEGNRIKFIRVSDGVDEFEDAEGNRIKLIKVSDGVEEFEDAEGNRFAYHSDAEIKHDVTPVGDADESDDTEGNKRHFR